MDKNLRILIVDDYRTMLRIVGGLLKQIGVVEVEEAGDGAAALARLKERSFDLVIAEWNMQPMTGLELLNRVRADQELEELPFIMITAVSRIASAIAAKEAGASDYILKPFDIGTLKTKIQGALCA